MNISRRKLLKLSGGILAAAPFVRMAHPALAHANGVSGPSLSDVTAARHSFGRAYYRGAIYEKASAKSKAIGKFNVGDLLPVSGQTIGSGPTEYNPIWYQTENAKGDIGFVHSALVQPCENSMNTPIASVAPDAITWGEVTVPLVAARLKADATVSVAMRLSSTIAHVL